MVYLLIYIIIGILFYISTDYADNYIEKVDESFFAFAVGRDKPPKLSEWFKIFASIIWPLSTILCIIGVIILTLT